jgi:hypothetical protein
VGGRLMNVGSSDTLHDNLAAAHLLTLVPMLCVYALTAADIRLRALAVVTAPFIINTFILCNSRGATLGLAVTGLAAMMLARRGHRIKMVGVAIAFAVAFYTLTDPTFIERQQTIVADDAGMERLITWAGARRLMIERPLGVGGGGFEYLSPVYIPDVVASHGGNTRSVHNTYLLIATEWGVQSLILFFGLIGTTFSLLHRIRKRTPAGDTFYFYRSLAVQLGLIGTLIAAMFSNRFLGESIYWMAGLAFALYRVQAAELGVEKVEQARPSAADVPGYRPAAAGAR